MRRRIRAGGKPGRIRMRAGLTRRSRMRKTRRGRRISAGRAARLLMQMFGLGDSLENALAPARVGQRVQPNGSFDPSPVAPWTPRAR